MGRQIDWSGSGHGPSTPLLDPDHIKGFLPYLVQIIYLEFFVCEIRKISDINIMKNLRIQILEKT